MAKYTKIGWTDSTFNCWRGCTKVSEGCAHCYAESDSHRNPAVLGRWGPNGTRVVAAWSKWKEVVKWEEEARDAGIRRRVFCASLADVFEQWDGSMVDSKGDRIEWSESRGFSSCPEKEGVGVGRWATMDDVRLRLFRLIMLTPHLDWLLVTKRPEHVMETLGRLATLCRPGEVCDYLNCWLKGSPPHNVWMITTAEDQANADIRIPELLKIPAVVRGVSYEPALGPVDWSRWMSGLDVSRDDNGDDLGSASGGSDLDWIIVGGESGARDKARPFDLAWARDTIRQCSKAGTACFVKQMGTNPIEVEGCGITPNSIPDAVMDYHLATGGSEPEDIIHPVKFSDRKGGDPAEWPEDLRVQEFPRSVR